MSKSLPKITQSHLYFAVYICIALATFRHSMEGFASFEGNLWLGALSALAVDALMILFAHSLRGGFKWALLFGMCFPAGLSVYTQLLFSTSNAMVVEVAPGAAWLGQTAVDIINARVWLLPISLPVSALLAALVGENESEETVNAQVHASTQDALAKTNREIAVLRKSAAEKDDRLSRLSQANQEHEQAFATLRSKETTKNASSLARAWNEFLYPNGDKPSAKVRAQVLNVSEGLIRKVDAEVSNE